MIAEKEDVRRDYIYLMREIEDFLYLEADLLDERRYEEWLALLSDDIRYWVPIRKNMAFRDREKDITGPDDIAWLDDDKETLVKRVKQIMTGVHWAEEPLSRVSHLISNIRLDKAVHQIGEGEEVLVKSHILVHRNRLETETDMLAGRRHDKLRRVGSSFHIVERKVILDQSVLLAKNLTFFF
jgi:3-phenylpropionate/cinnamic acid dioxygenase small subunit